MQIDYGDGNGFIVQGLIDDAQPASLVKSVNETPTLDCAVGEADVGREEIDRPEFTQYWDQSDANQLLVDTNLVESKTDPTKRLVTVQEVTPDFLNDLAAATSVTREYTAQIVSATSQTLTPQGYYKRTVSLLRKSPITRTVA